MNKTIADQQQRQRALDITASFIVQAPAGSGKTELISQRYLALLAACDKPESVLAITFTRKAASEMRLRILGALESARLPAPTEAHKLQTWQLARAVLQRDSQLNWQLMQSPARLQVVTIDSLNASLTRQMPLLSKMGTAASPLDSPEPLYLEAARRTLREVEAPQWQDDLSVLMLHLGNNVNRIQQLLVSLLSKRDQWLRHLGRSQNSDRRRLELEQSLFNLVEDHLQKLKNNLPAGVIQSLAELAEFAAQHVEPAKKPNIAIWQEFELNSLPAEPGYLAYWQGLAELLLTDSDQPRQRLDKNIGFPAPSSEKDTERKQLLQDKKQALQSLVDELATDNELILLFANLRNMPALTYTDRQWQLVEALSRILLLSAAHLRVVFSEQGQVDFSEIALSALEALGDDENPTELALVLDYQYQHILVDEFQDTSQGQFELLEKLTRDWQPGDGKTLFLVGDPMQSIYRFREAEVGLYLKARQQGISNIILQPLYLKVNFRSQQKIVDWVNQHLQHAFAHSEDISTGAVTYSPSVPFHEPLEDQAVNLHFYTQRDDRREADDVVSVVSRALAADDNSTVAILVRGRNHLLTIIEALKNTGLAFQAVDLDPLKEQRAVIDLYTLTRALHHYADRLHWLALLRSPLCGLQLPDLLVIAEGPEQVIWNNCRNSDLLSSLSEDGRYRVQKLVTQLQPYLENRGRLTLKGWIDNCWHVLGGNVAYADKTDSEAVDGFLELLDRHEQGGLIQDFKQFDDDLNKLYAPPDSLADGRLQIMTIHKSKGLEFDTVILPGLGKRGKNDETGLLEWLERPSSSGDSDLLMAPIKASESDKNDSISQSLIAINREKAKHELTRLLYVALTRSKKQLHLFASAKIDSKGQCKAESNSMLSILWPQLSELFEASDEPAEKQPDTTTANSETILHRLPLDWLATLPGALEISQTLEPVTEDNTQTDVEFDWATESARHVGTLTHRYLEKMASEKLANWTTDSVSRHTGAIEKGLKNLGITAHELQMATGKVITALENTLADQRGSWILQPHKEARSEYALTHYQGKSFQRFVIDRTFIDEHNVRWIIDYKTGSHEGSDKEAFLDREQQRYQPQLEQYARLLAQLDNRPIKLGLYFPMLKGWREWPFKTA